MAKQINLSQIQKASKNLKTEFLFNDSNESKQTKNQNKEVQIAFYLTREDAAKLNLIHAHLLVENGESMSRADRIRKLILKFIDDNSYLLKNNVEP